MNETNHKTLLDHLTTAVIVLTDRLCVNYLNPSAESMLSCSARQIMGVHFDKIFPLEEIKTSLVPLLETGHSISKREVQLEITPGKTITVDYTATPLSSPGKPTSLLLELQQLDRLLRITKEENLRQNHLATRSLIRGVAHEVKNPLGGIRGAAQLLEKKLPEEELREYTNVIISESDRLRSLVDKMLGPNKLTETEPTNIHECLERVRSLILAECPEIKFSRDYDTSLPEIEINKDQMIQVLLNICRNAVQAVREGDMTDQGEIILRTRVLRQYTIGMERHKLVMKVELIDNGPGISQELGETIFYPMVSGRAEGSGLGLNISQSIIQQYEGLIEFYSEPGNTNFTILLPM